MPLKYMFGIKKSKASTSTQIDGSCDVVDNKDAADDDNDEYCKNLP